MPILNLGPQASALSQNSTIKKTCTAKLWDYERLLGEEINYFSWSHPGLSWTASRAQTHEEAQLGSVLRSNLVVQQTFPALYHKQKQMFVYGGYCGLLIICDTVHDPKYLIYKWYLSIRFVCAGYQLVWVWWDRASIHTTLYVKWDHYWWTEDQQSLWSPCGVRTVACGRWMLICARVLVLLKNSLPRVLNTRDNENCWAQVQEDILGHQGDTRTEPLLFSSPFLSQDVAFPAHSKVINKWETGRNWRPFRELSCNYFSKKEIKPKINSWKL